MRLPIGFVLEGRHYEILQLRSEGGMVHTYEAIGWVWCGHRTIRIERDYFNAYIVPLQ
jgi:hypothetical protein